MTVAVEGAAETIVTAAAHHGADTDVVSQLEELATVVVAVVHVVG